MLACSPGRRSSSAFSAGNLHRDRATFYQQLLRTNLVRFTIRLSVRGINRQLCHNCCLEKTMVKKKAGNARQSREDPRVTRTRSLIREAFATLVVQKRFSDISVQDIAEQATINRATFYAHFEDKYALLEDSVRILYRSDLVERDPLSAKDISGLLATIALATFESARSHKNCKVDKEFEPQLERAMQDELYEFVLPVLGEASALVVSSAIIGAMMQWRAGRYKEPAEELVGRIVSVLSDGVKLQKRGLAAVS